MFRTLFVVSACYLFALFSATAAPTNVAEDHVLTQDQAVSALRSREKVSADADFVLVRKFEATAITRDVAQTCRDEAQSKHIKLYRSGVFVNLLQTGGFVILEYDAKTDMATRLHVVTLDGSGKAVTESQIIDGDLSKSEALELSRSAEAFTDAFLTSPGSRIKEVWQAYAAGVAPTFGASGRQGYFAIPLGVTKLINQPDELIDLSALSGALQLWPARYAMSMPTYAANPAAAVEMARNVQSKLEKEFLQEKKKSSEFVDDLLDLESIDTHEKLSKRLTWLRELNAFVDERHPLSENSSIRAVNVSISATPLKLGFTKQESDRLYAAMSAPGLISIWARAETGKFVLKDATESGE